MEGIAVRSVARATVGLVLAVAPVVLSGAPAVHANTQVNETCIISGETMTFFPILSTVYNGPYARNWTNSTCTDVVVTTNPLGVQLPMFSGPGSSGGSASGTCLVAVLSGGDWRNGAGVLIGGSVDVDASAFPLTSDIAFTQVDVMVPSGIPCLTEHSATGDGVNDTIL